MVLVASLEVLGSQGSGCGPSRLEQTSRGREQESITKQGRKKKRRGPLLDHEGIGDLCAHLPFLVTRSKTQ